MASGGKKRKFDEQESGNSMRQRRRRTAFTEQQLDRLEESFAEEKFPGFAIREKIAQELDIKEDRIQVWFQNRRSRWRKRELQKGHQQSPDAVSVIPPIPAFQPFSRKWDSTIMSWSFPTPFSPITTAAMERRCEAYGDQDSAMLGQSTAPYGFAMATSPANTSFPTSDRRKHHSLDEYVAAVTLASAFLRDH